MAAAHLYGRICTIPTTTPCEWKHSHTAQQDIWALGNLAVLSFGATIACC